MVFWNDLIHDLEENDPVTAKEIVDQAFVWVDQTVDIKGRKPVRGIGGGYSMRRQRLLDILSKRATELGAKIVIQTAKSTREAIFPDPTWWSHRAGSEASSGASVRSNSARDRAGPQQIRVARDEPGFPLVRIRLRAHRLRLDLVPRLWFRGGHEHAHR